MVSARVGWSCVVAALIAAGAWQLLDGIGAIGFALFLLGAIGGFVLLISNDRDPSVFVAALSRVVEWLSSLR